MRILTLDLSTRSSGWCVGENKIIEASGYVTASSKNTIERIIIMKNKIAEIIQNNNIQKIIIEEVRPEYNSYTNKILMWLQAAIVIIAYQIATIQCEFISANEWRAALKIKQGPGIKRESLKSQDIQYVQDKYNLKVSNDDEADAICIFDAYWQKNNNEINWE